MIRTVTLNTGFDEVFAVSGVEWAGVSQVLDYRSSPSGKGINAAQTARRLGEPVRAYGLVGSENRSDFVSALASENIECSVFPVPGATRRNLTLLDRSSGRPAAHFRARGFELDGDSPLRALIDALTADTRPGDVVSLHGSIPVGLSDDAWIEVCNGATRKGARVLVDTYGNPLLRVLGGTPVFAAKPNEEEISVLTETRNVPFTTAAAAALREMNRLGVILPFVSLGERGIAFLAGEHPRIASCRVRQPTVLVGAGDACVGALAVALARGVVDVEELVAFMVAAGAAHVSDVAPDEFADETRALSAHVQVGPLAR